jgi:hypothetical protein
MRQVRARAIALGEPFASRPIMAVAAFLTRAYDKLGNE